MFFFFNDTATTEIYTLSLHDALPISHWRGTEEGPRRVRIVEFLSVDGRSTAPWPRLYRGRVAAPRTRSEEHTSELQSRLHLVCRLLLDKKRPPAAPRSHFPPHVDQLR